MATAKKTKTKKDDLFEAEEFDLDENQDEMETSDEVIEDIEPDDADIIPEELDEEITDEHIEDLVSIDDTIGIADEEGVIIPSRAEVGKEDLDEEEMEDEISDTSSIPQQSTVRICPHCNEEVLDLEVCPLCGNPLSPSVDDTVSKDLDAEGMMLDFDEEEQAMGIDNRFDDKYEELFDDLPYQDKY